MKDGKGCRGRGGGGGGKGERGRGEVGRKWRGEGGDINGVEK